MTHSPNNPEPAPKAGAVDVWPLVIADMTERNAIGKAKYGTPLQTENGRDSLVDAYQETLDLAVYLRQRIEEDKRHAVDRDALADVLEERRLQDGEWPSRDDLVDKEWLGLIDQQIAKARHDMNRFRDRMVKIAALAIAAIGSEDRSVARSLVLAARDLRHDA